MPSASRQAHWEDVYTKKGEHEVSWFQENPAPSLELIAQVGAIPASAVIDIGGGASRLVDNLLSRGFQDVTVLDLSEAALGAAKARLGSRARQVHWIVADATAWDPPRAYAIAPDRQRRSNPVAIYSAATICCVRHWPIRARSEAGLTGLLSTAIVSSRAAARTCGLRSAVIRMAGMLSPKRRRMSRIAATPLPRSR